MMKRFGPRNAVAGLFVGTALLLATDSADAANEFYMMFNCNIDSPSAAGWGLNTYGYYNTSTTDFLFLTCQQPHLVGVDGHNGGSAIVWDRHGTSSVVVELCRNNGSGDESCNSQFSNNGSPETLTFLRARTRREVITTGP